MSGNQGIMRIGEVHAELRKYFPDIELSKIRYYEDKGLVQPSRSRKGYRLYSERDVECLREAIRLAQEEFVPLRVVRLRLIEQGLLRDVPVPSSPRHAAREALSNVVSIPAPPPTPPEPRPTLKVVPPSIELTMSGEQQFFSKAEFLSTTGLDPAVVTQLHVLGLLAPVSLGREVAFSEFDVQVATLAQALLDRGLEIRLLGSLRRVAEREIGVIDDLSAPLRSKWSDCTTEQTQSATVEVAAEVGALRSVLYERALHNYLTSQT
ncbi:MAG TPA: MerR family transcriptional regulator [Acidimicrobiales bacterium]|nr:MerR family transcriptional regulator [Acidimicrobiales bacterium]